MFDMAIYTPIVFPKANEPLNLFISPNLFFITSISITLLNALLILFKATIISLELGSKYIDNT